MTGKHITLRRSAGRPTREQAALIDDQILAAAQALFCRDGFSDVSMNQIAERIGASKLTLYRRFASKEGLLGAVVDRNIASLRVLMGEALHGRASAMAALQEAVRRMFDFLTTPENLAFGLIIRVEAARLPSIRERCAEWISIMEEPLVILIARCQEDGTITRRVDALVLADILSDLIDGVAERLRNHSVGHEVIDLTASFGTRWEAFLAYAIDR
jgi:AcrR family transcriptional regulator